MREIYRLTAAEKAELLEFTRELVRIPSENPPGHEAPAADCLVAKLEEAGIATTRVPLTGGGRDCVFAALGDRNGGASVSDQPHLAFSGHLDVVPVQAGEEKQWRIPPYSAVVHEGKLWGRGACDMKGGLAAAVCAMIFAKRRAIPLRCPVDLAATVDEEDLMQGSRALVSAGLLRQADRVLICEPTGLALCTAGRGRTWAEIRVTGRSGHGSQPAVTANSIVLTMDLLKRVMETHPGGGEQRELDERYGVSFWQPLRIEAGMEPSVVPAECRFSIDARLRPGNSCAEIWRCFDQIVDRFHADYPTVELSYEVVDRREPWIAGKDDTFVRDLREAARLFAPELKESCFPGSTDGNVFMTTGLRPLILGPGDLALAHRANEFVGVEDLYRACEIYLNLMTLPENE